jgi:hypothetical protein
MQMNFDINQLLKLDVNKLLKRREIVIGLVIIIIALFVSRFVYMKQVSTAVLLKDKLTEQMEAGRLLVELNKLEADFENLKKGITVGQISTVSVVDMITEMARKRDISISSINPRNRVDNGLYWEYTFEIEMEGDYRRTKGLLSDVENSDNLFKVDFLSVSNAGTAGRNNPKFARVKMVISAISWKE